MNCIEMSLYAEQERKKIEEWQNRLDTPAFAIYTGITLSGYHNTMMYSHNKEGLGQVLPATHKAYSSEFAHSSGNHKRTNSYPSSSSSYASSTSASGHLGHSIIRVTKTGETIFTSSSSVSPQRDVGTWTNSTRPDLAIFMNGDKYWFGPRKMSSDGTGAYGQKTGLPGVPDTEKYGSIGYNEKTGRMAMLIPATSGGSFKIASWDNIIPPYKFDNSEDFFSQPNFDASNKVETTWFGFPGTTPRYKECKRRAIVTVCDNGTIICSKLFPHYGYSTIEIVETSGVYVIPTTNLFWHHWTTTYGCEQGDLYGIRHRTTLDGKYIVSYACTYYYGAGIRFSITRVSDGKTMSHFIQDSRYGFQFTPIGDDDFMLSFSMNSDAGYGLSHYNLGIKEQLEAGSNGDSLLIGTVVRYKIDTGYYSTNYPLVVPIVQDKPNLFIKGYMT